jgi:predicted nucleic acid-binding protein
MEPVYIDASALVKLFVPEEESDALNRALAGLTDVIVSDLALTEMASALSAARASNALRAKRPNVSIVKRRSARIVPPR